MESVGPRKGEAGREARRAQLAQRVRERSAVLHAMAERIPASADTELREWLKVVLRTTRNVLDDVADLLDEERNDK